MTVWSLIDKTVRHINLPKEASPGLDFSPGGSHMAVAERRAAKDCIAIYSCDCWVQVTVNLTSTTVTWTIDELKHTTVNWLRNNWSGRPALVTRRYQNRSLGPNLLGQADNLLNQRTETISNRTLWHSEHRVGANYANPFLNYSRIQGTWEQRTKLPITLLICIQSRWNWLIT